MRPVSAQRRGSGSGPSPRCPVPSTVSMMPALRSIRRMTWFSVSATNSAPPRPSESLGSGQARRAGGTAVAGIALLARASDVMDRRRPARRCGRSRCLRAAPDRGRRRGRTPAFAVRSAASRPAARRPASAAARRCRHRSRSSGGEVDAADAVVADVADQQPAPGSTAMLCGSRSCAWSQGRRRRRTRRRPCPRRWRSLPLPRRPAHDVVVALGDVEVAARRRTGSRAAC